MTRKFTKKKVLGIISYNEQLAKAFSRFSRDGFNAVHIEIEEAQIIAKPITKEDILKIAKENHFLGFNSSAPSITDEKFFAILVRFNKKFLTIRGSCIKPVTIETYDDWMVTAALKKYL